MDAVVTLARDAEKAGILAAALLAAGAVLVRTPRARAACVAGALVLTPVLLLVQIWDTPQVRPLRERPALAVAGALVTLAAVVGAAVLLDRRPRLFALAVVAALPFRVPIESGGQTANLLVLLYFVIGAGALAFAYRQWRDAPPDRAPPPARVEQLLLGLVVLYALQAAYSSDFPKALQQVVFFYVPFALAYVILVRLDWTRRLVRQCFGVLIALALVFSAIGFVEYATRTLLLNPRVIASNQFQSYFRVNSLFFDPNIFGRFLVIVMLATAAGMLWARRRRDVLLALGALAVLWGGLVLTLSQSSLTALLAGLAVLAALRYSVRWTLAAGAAAVLAGLVVLVAFPGAVGLHSKSRSSLDEATSGRSKLISGGLHLFADRPVYGWGSASFPREFRRQRFASAERALAASHTIPITVAAEQGFIGLLVYLALLAVALARLLRGAGASPERTAVAAAFVALVVHTYLYAAFLEDPLVWVLLAVGTALAARRPPDPEPGLP